jgi:hypothetical protein
MTPREQWEAVVRLQHEAACAIDELPPDADLAAEQRVCDIVNGATDDLLELGRELPPGTFSDDEWYAAYSIHRNAMLAATRRNRSHDALATVEAVRAGAVELHQRAHARRYFE